MKAKTWGALVALVAVGGTGCVTSKGKFSDLNPQQISTAVTEIVAAGERVANVKLSLKDSLALVKAAKKIEGGDVSGGVALIKGNEAAQDLVLAAVGKYALTTNALPEGDWASLSVWRTWLNTDAWRDAFGWVPGISGISLPDALPDWDPVPVPAGEATLLPSPHVAAFLLDGAGTRCMNGLSKHIGMDEFKSDVARQIGAGANTLWLFLSNQGDGRGAPVSFYSNQRIWGPVDAESLAQMHAKCQWARSQGLALVFWMFADDSGDNSKAAIELQVAFLERGVAEFGRYAAGWCVALEADEHMGKDRVTALTAALDKLTELPLFMHQLSGRSNWVGIPGIDGMMYQYGFGKSASQVAAETREKKPGVGNRLFIGAEYHKSSDSSEARSMGRAILDAGAHGAGNGAFRSAAATTTIPIPALESGTAK